MREINGRRAILSINPNALYTNKWTTNTRLRISEPGRLGKILQQRSTITYAKRKPATNIIVDLSENRSFRTYRSTGFDPDKSTIITSNRIRILRA